jgi:hypothetical protein
MILNKFEDIWGLSGYQNGVNWFKISKNFKNMTVISKSASIGNMNDLLHPLMATDSLKQLNEWIFNWFFKAFGS